MNSALQWRKPYLMWGVSLPTLWVRLPPLSIESFNQIISGAARQLPVKWVS